MQRYLLLAAIGMASNEKLIIAIMIVVTYFSVVCYVETAEHVMKPSNVQEKANQIVRSFGSQQNRGVPRFLGLLTGFLNALASKFHWGQGTTTG